MTLAEAMARELRDRAQWQELTENEIAVIMAEVAESYLENTVLDVLLDAARADEVTYTGRGTPQDGHAENEGET